MRWIEVVVMLDPTRDRSWEARLFWEDVLEDFVVWYTVFQPTGRFCSADSVSKYASSVRAWVRRLVREVPRG